MKYTGIGNPLCWLAIIPAVASLTSNVLPTQKATSNLGSCFSSAAKFPRRSAANKTFTFIMLIWLFTLRTNTEIITDRFTNSVSSGVWGLGFGVWGLGFG